MPATLASADLPPRVRHILDGVLTTVRAELGSQLLQVVQEAELALLHAVPVNPHDNVAHQTSLRNLRYRAPQFSAHFLATIEAAVVTLHHDAAHTGSAPPQPGEVVLSLIDDEQVSDEALLEAIASRAESRNSLALQLLGHRLGVLAGTPALEGQALPLGPRGFAQALLAAVRALELSPHTHPLLFDLFEKHVLGAYPTLLDVLNTRLVEDGVLPHLRFIPSRPRPSGSHPPGHRNDEPRMRDTAGAQAASAPADTAAGTGRHAAKPGDDRFAMLQALLQQRRILMAKLRPGGSAPRGHASALPSVELDEALRRLRTNGAEDHSLEHTSRDVLAQARQWPCSDVGLASSDSDVHELLSLFFEQLQREMTPSSPGDELVRQLRLPLLQLALQDHRFFVDAGHPARQLLDTVSLAGARWLGEDDSDPQWLALLQQAVARIGQDIDGSPVAFERANQVLQDDLRAHARRATMTERRQIEAARGREKLALARQHAHAELARRMHGRNLPRFEAILLQQAWGDVLSLGHLRNGEGSDGLQQLLQTTSRLIEIVAGEAGGTPDPALLEQVRTLLDQVGYHHDDARAIAAQLTGAELPGAADLTTRTALLVQLRARARLGDGSVPGQDGADAPLSHDAQAAYDRMKRPGASHWIEIEETPGRPVRRRLAWTSARTGQTLLLNRRGQRVPGPGLVALARQTGEGRVRLLANDTAPTEAAWQALTRSLQRMADGSAAEKEAGHGY